MSDFLFDLLQRNDAETLYICQDQASGLKAVIAIHSTVLGPAAGGIRMWPYTSEREAIADAVRLARAMTYKWAAAGINYGGGKCVVLGDPTEKSEALLHALGRFIQRLNGLFFVGTDVGTTIADMEILAQKCDFVVPTSESRGGSGDSGPATASGVVQGIRACLQFLYGSSDLQGRTVAVQGLGSVGRSVVTRLIEGGATITVTDIDSRRVAEFAATSGIQVAETTEIVKLPVDIYCPCALGSVVNENTIDAFQCKIICGSANNQLAEERCGDLLTSRGILYAPDYIVNAGGALWSMANRASGGFNRQYAESLVAHIYETMMAVIELARTEQLSTARAADLLAERRIAAARQQ